MDWTLFTGILGSAGLFSLIQYLVTRHDRKHDRIGAIETKIDNIDKKCDRNELATTRLQLLWLIKTQPKNHDTILRTAQRYFIDLDGNAEAYDVFDHWRKVEDVSISWFESVSHREENTKRRQK